jgi:hypothetical protein
MNDFIKNKTNPWDRTKCHKVLKMNEKKTGFPSRNMKK